MRVLMAMPDAVHGHNYLGDYLVAGFRALLGPHNVYDIPEAPWLHLDSIEARDECVLDCDATWPRHYVTTAQAHDHLRSGWFDLIVVTDAFTSLAALAVHNVRHVPVVFVDGDDRAKNHLQEANNAAQNESVEYFKRELPLDAMWAYPCPMTYPEEKVRVVTADNRDGREARLVYHTVAYGPGAPRDRIVASLADQPWADVSANRLERWERLTPEAVHDRMAKALVSCHWNPPFDPVTDHAGQSGWDANRFWENCAMGVVTIAQRPFIRFPAGTEFTDGENVVWVDRPEDVAPAAQALIDDPDRARAMAVAAQRWFLDHHCARERAKYILRTCGFEDEDII